MLQFTESKKPQRKRDLKAKTKKIVDSDNSSDEGEMIIQEAEVRKPAWVDKHAAKLKVSIDEVSRLRKLKKTEGEQVIEGADYAARLKEHYVNTMQGSDMFAWAHPKASTRKNTLADADEDEEAGPTKVFADSDSDDDSDDPIGNLLKSNTAIFSRSEELLKPGILKQHKLRNANASTQHQSVVTSMSFHPSENLLITAGLDRKAKLI